ncbi:MAG: deoxyuridine 5'-triphosphate nucleotidohydrolase [Candidatus Omnitrophica bacterium]|nr:deoxyuridine 5'-triphosphate nucleotidohydrolase [Candidatus Omnitrophota bacterium]
MIVKGSDILPLMGPGLVSPEIQIQPAGIDLTVKHIREYRSGGVLDFTNEQRVLPKTDRLFWGGKDTTSPYINLAPGGYLVELDPIVSIPNDMIAFAQPRSSLTRMGCGIHSGIWDPGYKGNSTVVLNVYNPHGVRIYKNARIAQLIYARMESSADKLYDGVYQGSGIIDETPSNQTGLK